MSNQQNIVKLIKAISGQANVLTIPRVYLSLLNNKHRAALLLSQCVYWSDKSKSPDGWFYKTDAEWKEELGLTRGGLDTALKEGEKYLETKVARVGPTPKSHYRVNLDLLVSDISDLLETDKSDLPENGDSSMTETTTEITLAAKTFAARNSPEVMSLSLRFVELSGIDWKAPKSKKDWAAVTTLWLDPLRFMLTTANSQCDAILAEAIRRMRRDGLTIANPHSVEKVFTSICGERKSGAAPALSPDEQRLNEKRAALRRQGIG